MHQKEEEKKLGKEQERSWCINSCEVQQKDASEYIYVYVYVYVYVCMMLIVQLFFIVMENINHNNIPEYQTVCKLEDV